MMTSPENSVPLMEQSGSINLSSELLADVGMEQSGSINLSSELLADVVGFDQELIIEILLRLPVKSLLKFKCVSKSWLCLISSPQFISSHFSTSESNEDLYVNSSFVFYPRMFPTVALRQFTLSSALYDPSANVSDIEYPSHKSKYPPCILGIVNGLICLIDVDDLFLWNPVLRKSKRFSCPDFHPNPKGYKCDAHGFGYDESNDDYKVVFMECKDKTVVMVYSLRTDSWRAIEDSKPGLPLQGRGKYANGKIHWVAWCSVDGLKIVSLDMGSEKFGELQCPGYETGVSSWVLGVLKGRLSMLCDYYKRKGDLWVMDKNGVDESWSKLVSIPYGIVYPATSLFCPRVICVLRNGVVVLSTATDSLLVYHSEHKEFRNIVLVGSKDCELRLCLESLVSPVV